MNAVSTYVYARTQTAIFVTDKLRVLLKVLVNHYELDPTALLDAWSGWIERAARVWLESGHLTAIIIEFYWPGADTALARWDFPIQYDGNGVDEMWIDRYFLEGAFAKAKAPPSGCSYRVLLRTAPGEPQVDGVGNTTMLSVDGLVARDVGTVIATPDIMASARYYR